nr:wd repeat-containing protein aac3 [Quercus suber]
MAPPIRSRPLSKVTFPIAFRSLKAQLYSESISGRPSALVPNIRAVTWSPTGALIATCTQAHIRIWSPDRPNVKSSTEIKNAHPKGGVAGASGDIVEKISFCPTTENLLASTGNDGCVRLWDVRVPGGTAVAGKGTPLGDCSIGEAGVLLTWHPHGSELLVSRKDGSIYNVDVRQMEGTAVPSYEMGASERTQRAGKTRYNSLAFSNTGREILATSAKGPVQIFDFNSMSLLHTLSGHSCPTYAAQHSPNGTCVAVGSADSLVSVWDTSSWHCSHTVSTLKGSIRDLSFSFDGTYLVTGHAGDAKELGEKNLEVVHVDLGEVVHTIDTIHPVSLVAFHPLRYHIAYTGDGGGMKIVGVGSSV